MFIFHKKVYEVHFVNMDLYQFSKIEQANRIGRIGFNGFFIIASIL